MRAISTTVFFLDQLWNPHALALDMTDLYEYVFIKRPTTTQTLRDFSLPSSMLFLEYGELHHTRDCLELTIGMIKVVAASCEYPGGDAYRGARRWLKKVLERVHLAKLQYMPPRVLNFEDV